MQNAALVLNQVVVMALLALAGYALLRCGLVRPAASVSLSNILLYAVLPCLIISSLQRDYEAGEARAFALALLLSALSFLVFIVLAHLLVRQGAGNVDTGLVRFCLAMPNAGYIGIPMVQAVLGADGVFFLTAYIAEFNLLLFSYGRFQLQADSVRRGLADTPPALDRGALRQCLINPATVGALVGFTLYVARIRLPGPLLEAAKGLSSLNSVVAMLLIGMFLAQTELGSLLRFKRGIFVALLRLVALPAAYMLVLAFLDVSWFTADGYTVKTALVIAACGPVAVAASFMSELCGADSICAVKHVAVSTLLSVVTMPCMLLLWEALVALAR